MPIPSVGKTALMPDDRFASTRAMKRESRSVCHCRVDATVIPGDDTR
jgi:hypothetical protein